MDGERRREEEEEGLIGNWKFSSDSWLYVRRAHHQLATDSLEHPTTGKKFHLA